PDGELRLWSCNTASGQPGVAFIDALVHATGADVAAATSPIGAAARGGTWQLTAHSDRTTAQPPLTDVAAANYAGVLVTKTWTGTTSATWSVGTNWSPANAPAIGDDVIIPDTIAPAFLPTLAANTTINSLAMTGTTANRDTLTINTG